MHEHAKRILADTRRMLAAVRTASKSGLPQLKIGFIDSFGDAAATALMTRIEALAMQLSLQTGVNAPLSQAFLNRDLDLLITSDPIDDHPELERHAILRDPFVMLAANDHCRGATVTAELLAATVPFVRYTRNSRLGTLTELVTRRLNIEPRSRYELDSTQTLLGCVQSGQGWAIATALCLVQYPALLEGVTVMPLGNSANARYLSLLARHDELGDVPKKIALICREICEQDVLPRIFGLAPWLKDHARAIEEVPII